MVHPRDPLATLHPPVAWYARFSRFGQRCAVNDHDYRPGIGPSPIHDFGVLFVHGIGESRRAETLVHFAEPVLTRVRELIEEDYARRGTNPPGEPAVKVLDAELTGKEGAPAYAAVHVGVPDPDEPERPTQRWLIAESWWAESFPTPTFSDVAAWGFETIPWTLVAHFDDRLRRLGYQAIQAIEPGNKLVTRRQALLGWLSEAFWLFIGLLLVPLLMLVIALLLVLGAVPITAVRDLVGTLQRAISAYIGDSFVFMGQSITSAAVTRRVARDFAWLSSRCRRVTVIAHSQGAAVAHRALRNQPMRSEDTLITFGSGLRKLTEIERMRAHPHFPSARAAIWWAAFGAVTAALSLRWLYLALPLPAWSALLVSGLLVMGMIGLGGILIGLLQVWRRRTSAPPATASSPAGTRPAGTRSHAPPRLSRTNVLSTVLFILLASGLSLMVVLTLRFLGPGSLSMAHIAGLLPWVTAMAAGLGVGYTALMHWRQLSGRSTDRREQEALDRTLYAKRYQFPGRGFQWHDYFASADPVPNGPLLDRFQPQKLRSTAVDNLRSILRDHTTYWHNRDGFVAPVTNLIVAQARICPAGDARAEYATMERRRWRVRWLVASRLTLAAAAFAVFAAATHSGTTWLGDVLARLADLGMPQPDPNVRLRSVVFGDAALADYFLGLSVSGRQWFALFVSAAFWAVTYAACALAWRGWNAVEVGGRGKPSRPGLALFVATFCLSLAIMAAPVLFELGGHFAGADVSNPQTRMALGFAALASALLMVDLAAFRLGPGPGQPGTAPDGQSVLHQTLALADDAIRAERPFDAIDLGWRAHAVDPGEAVQIWERTYRQLESADAAYLVSLYARDDRQRYQAAKSGAGLGQGRVSAACAAMAGYLAEPFAGKDEATAMLELAYQGGETDVIPALAHAVREQDPERAKALLSELADAGDPRGHHELAVIYDRQGNHASQPEDRFAAWRQAAAHFDQALLAGMPEAALPLGAVYRKLNEVANARAALQQGLRLTLPGANLGMAELEMAVGRPDVAEEYYRWEMESHPDTAPARQSAYQLGQLAERKDLITAAEYYYTIAAGGEHPIEDAALRLGSIYESSHRHDHAEALYRRMVRIPWSSESRLRLAGLLQRSMRPDEAAQVLLTSPHPLFEPRLHVSLARQVSNDANARRLLDRAFRQDPTAAFDPLRERNVPDEEINRLIATTIAESPHWRGPLARLLEERGLEQRYPVPQAPT